MPRSSLTWEELEERRLATLAADTINDYKPKIESLLKALNKQETIQVWRDRFNDLTTMYKAGYYNTFEEYVIARQELTAALLDSKEVKLIKQYANEIGKVNVQMCEDYLAQIDSYIPLVETTAATEQLFEIKATIGDKYSIPQSNVIKHLQDAITVDPKTGRPGIYTSHNHVVFPAKSRNNTYTWSSVKATKIITEAITDGWSPNKMAKEFYTMQGQNMSAAKRNARTAITSARNWGQLNTMEEAQKYGIIIQKKWLCTHDDRTRSSHRRIDGEVQNLSDNFSIDVEYPGDPKGPAQEIYNCRCTMLSVINGKQQETISQKRYFELVEEQAGITYSEYHNAAKGALTRRKTVTATSSTGEVKTFNSVDEAKSYFGSKSTIEYGKEFTKGKYKGWTFSK